MTTVVLVTYATRYGSTEEVANTIAATLREHKLDVEVRPAREVHSLEGYHAVVIGAPLYMGRWHHHVRHFVKRHRQALSELPVAVFALGPLSTDEKAKQTSTAQFERALAKLYWLAPNAVAIFGGDLDPSRLSFPWNRMAKSDVRDWTEIRTWAGWIVPVVRPPQRTGGQQTLVR